MQQGPAYLDGRRENKLKVLTEFIPIEVAPQLPPVGRVCGEGEGGGEADRQVVVVERWPVCGGYEEKFSVHIQNRRKLLSND